MHVGLLGAGRIGQFHAATLRADPRVRRLLIGDSHADRAVVLADKLGAEAAPSPLDVLDAGVDAVVVTASTSAHADLVGAAVARGLPVFCEKPVALDLAGTRAVLDAVAEAGVPLQVGFQRRFDAGYLAAHAALADGAVGTLHTVRMVGADPAPPHPSYLPTSGGIFRDLHIHDFDALRWLTGRDIVRVFATGANRGDPAFAACGDSDTVACLLWLDDGTLATLTGSRYNGAGYDIRMELAGTRATLAIGLDDRTPLRSCEPAATGPAGPFWAGFLDRFAPAYTRELNEFVEVAAGNRPSPCSGAESLAALRVAVAADRSLAEGRAVDLDEVPHADA